MIYPLQQITQQYSNGGNLIYMDTYMENNNSKNNTDENNTMLENDLKSLQEKYDNLSKEVQSLENMKSGMSDSIKIMHSSFADINKNIGDILERLDKITVNSTTNPTDFNMPRMHFFPLRNLIGRPLRKLAVGTLSGIYTIADKTLESAYSVKENAEDIFAEAQYDSKKRRMHTADQS